MPLACDVLQIVRQRIWGASRHLRGLHNIHWIAAASKDPFGAWADIHCLGGGPAPGN